jgi:1-deoxy-D-xylulose-5-phosphate synthase
MLHEIFKKFKKIITVEDGTIIGGLATAISEFMIDEDYCAKLIHLGIPDRFIEQGSLAELHAECGIDDAGIEQAVNRLLTSK